MVGSAVLSRVCYLRVSSDSVGDSGIFTGCGELTFSSDFSCGYTSALVFLVWSMFSVHAACVGFSIPILECIYTYIHTSMHAYIHTCAVFFYQSVSFPVVCVLSFCHFV